MAGSDEELVRAVLDGERSAFAELYDRRARLIRAICFDQTRDVDVAADLAQEAFLRAYRNLGRLQDSARFAAWLTGIARQVCREWRRGRLRERRALASVARDGSQSDGFAAPRDERLIDLREAIAAPVGGRETAAAGLSQQQRAALHAFYLQGRAVDEASTSLGLSRATFYRVLSAACQRLRSMLNGREALHEMPERR